MHFSDVFPVLLAAGEPGVLSPLRLLAAAEIAFGLGVLLTLAGVHLQWHLPRRQMSLEERKKDGHLTEAGATRWIVWQRYSAPAFTVAGAILMIGGAWGWI
jgi:hypothetical protein